MFRELLRGQNKNLNITTIKFTRPEKAENKSVAKNLLVKQITIQKYFDALH